MKVTDGTLLGGRVIYRQPEAGYRTGLEPVLMAASIPAQPGLRVLEAGTGAGAALLCLQARLPGVSAMGVERDSDLAELARENLAANGMAGAEVRTGDILALPPMPEFDHAIANPPWHEASATGSPDARRDAAKRGRPGLLANWAAAMVRLVRPGGNVTYALPAGALAEGIAALTSAGCGEVTLMPLWPRVGQDARLILLRATRDRSGPSRILNGLVLHEGDGFTALARSVLWDGAALPWS